MKRTPHGTNVVSIPPGAPYLPTLVDALISGSLIEGFVPANDPLGLADVTIWVPTRRAARALATEFVSRLEGEVALLPAIRALGDAEDDSLFFTGSGDAVEQGLNSTIGVLPRQLILAQLINRWAATLNETQRKIYQGAEILVPSSQADAVRFAADLAHLMDMVATEEADWNLLKTLVPDAYADWWQLTLEFLKISMEVWPALLAERGLNDAATLRAQMLRRQAASYAEGGSRGPVIAAGSTGSIPATADLLKTIAGMKNGVVVLPALDRDLDAATWAKIDLPDNDRDDDGTAPGHPQYGLKKLIDHIGIPRAEVVHIGGVEDMSAGYARIREHLVSEALRPSFSTSHWQQVFEKYSTDQRKRAFESITLIEAAGEREEALCIALALRETLENNKKTAALVTPDRNLARRVASELRRFGLEVDDSAGQPLRNRPVGTFVRLVLEVAFKEADPVSLASLIKHPLTTFGASPQRARTAARLFEIVALRGNVMPLQAGECLAHVKSAHAIWQEGFQRQHAALKRMSETDWDDVFWLADSLDTVFSKPSFAEDHEHLLTEYTQRSAAMLEACGRDENGQLLRLYDGEDGMALHALLAELLEHDEGLRATPREWPDIFDSLLGSRVVRAVGGAHPRVAILGPLEVRLQTYDRVVLGGLNEGTWPASSRNDPFLSRPMKSALGLPPPERRTGLAAHDFQVLLGMEDIVLTRAVRADNAPTVASRWVQRTAIVAGEEATVDMRGRGKRFIQWAARIDVPAGAPRSTSRPEPRPPLAARPKGLSITEIETWIADPYSIYAKHILELDALDPLNRSADARERGTLYHRIVEDFVRANIDPSAAKALEQMLTLARRGFAEAAIPQDVSALWWPRFETIATAFMDWHRQHLRRVGQIQVESRGRIDVDDTGFTLRGRTDRIDCLKNGNLSIVDYKTGTKPSKSQVNNLQAPQLPLTAAMAERGAFDGIDPAQAEELLYIRLRPEDELQVDKIGHAGRAKAELSAHELANLAWEQLNALIAAYEDPQKPYVSQARPITEAGWESDYDHLARVREWSTGEEGDAGES